MFFGASGSIAGGQITTFGQPLVVRDVGLAMEDCGRILRDVGEQEPEDVLIWGRDVDVAAPDPVATGASGARRAIAAGCGSWTIDEVVGSL